jgi:uncharacterized protein
MAVITIDQESVVQQGFYVPRFQVLVNGVGLPEDVIRDVVTLTYHDSIKEIDSFEMTVANWDTETFDYKYIGSRAETRKVLDNQTSRQSQLFHLFEPCNHEVEIQFGYLGSLINRPGGQPGQKSSQLRTMMRGNFTTMEPSFTGGGAATLTVRGLNVLHQLRRKQYTNTFIQRKPSEIATDLSNLREEGQKRLPLPVTVNKQAQADEDSLDIVSQKNQYDVDFLFTLARRFGYVVYVVEADPANNVERSLYFGPSDLTLAGSRDVTFKLERGKSIVDFKPTLTTANQVKSVTVNGYNRVSGKEFSVVASLDKLKAKKNEDLYSLLQRCDPREEVVVDRPVFDETEALKIAEGILRDRQKDMVKASVSTVGLPDLVAGKNVLIEGFGARLDGKYFITDSTHSFNDSGYTTQFNCRREDDTSKGSQA